MSAHNKPDPAGHKPASSKHHLQHDPEWEIHPHELHELRSRQHPHVLLDVRTPREHEAANIQGAVLVPLDQLPHKLEELKQHADKRIIVHCHHGSRSLRATAFLRHAGFKHVHSLAGGIDSWSLLIDPAVKRY